MFILVHTENFLSFLFFLYFKSSVWKNLFNFSFWKQTDSPFRLTSLIYAEKFELENPAIMENKQCKQTERYSQKWQKEAIIFCC